MPNFIKAIKSFQYAIEGFIYLIKKENNFKIHLVATLIVVTLGFYANISQFECIALLFCIGIVLMAEALNTSIEKVVDLISPNFNPIAKIAKDISATAVLLASILAIIEGFLIFKNYLYLL